MSQMDLYKATGLDRTFISDLERGIQGPSLKTVFRVARGVGMEPEILIFCLPERRGTADQGEEGLSLGRGAVDPSTILSSESANRCN